MKNIYIGNQEKLFSFLKNKYNFINYKVDIKSKNNIIKIINDLSQRNTPNIIISDGVCAYYSYYALDHLKSVGILINPTFIHKTGKLVEPSILIGSEKKKNKSKVVLLSEKNPYLKEIIKFLDSDGTYYIVSDGVIKLLENELDKVPSSLFSV